MKKVLYLLVVSVLLFTSCKRDHIHKPGKGDTTVVKNPCVQGFPTLVWVKPISDSTANTADASSIAVGSDKNLIVFGTFNGTGDFDPTVTGIFNLTAPSANASYQQRFDVTGKFLNASLVNAAGLPPLPAGAIERLRDVAGNYYTYGSFEGTYDFDPGTGVSNLTYNGPPEEVGGEYYIQKLDAAGNFKWAILTGIILTVDNTSTAFDIDTDGPGYLIGWVMLLDKKVC